MPDLTRHMSGVLPLLPCVGLGFTADRGAAQEVADPSTDPAPSISGTVQLSQVADNTTLHLGVAAELAWGRWSVGAAGFGITSPAKVRAVAGPDSELSLGYGGVVVRYSDRLRPRLEWSGALLMGGGGAEHVDAFGTTIAKDVFVAAEGTASVAWSLAPLATVGARVGYRWVGGVDDLVGPGAADLRSIVVGVTLRILPRAHR